MIDLGSLGLPVGATAPTAGTLPACPAWLTPVYNLENAWRTPTGYFNMSPAGSAAQRAGKRYEKRVMAFLRDVFPARLHEAPWYQLVDNHGMRYCQPDAILDLGTYIVVIEVKRTHSVDAWWQLRHLYEPVVSVASGNRQVGVLEICRSFDPAVRLPEPVSRIERITDIEGKPRSGFTVFQWR